MKNLKKLLALMLILAMSVCMFTACGDEPVAVDDDDDEVSDTKKDKNEEDAEEYAEEEEEIGVKAKRIVEAYYECAKSGDFYGALDLMDPNSDEAVEFKEELEETVEKYSKFGMGESDVAEMYKNVYKYCEYKVTGNESGTDCVTVMVDVSDFDSFSQSEAMEIFEQMAGVDYRSASNAVMNGTMDAKEFFTYQSKAQGEAVKNVGMTEKVFELEMIDGELKITYISD